MIHFPVLYDDELLYSAIARYHIRVGNYFWKHTIEDLFGTRTVRSSVFLQSHIQDIMERLPPPSTLTTDQIIRNHTLYPFYTAFMTNERAEQIYQALLGNRGQGVYMQSGVMASAIRQNKYLKYCPLCFKDLLDKYGELYWMRHHQLPGVLICDKHDVWLKESAVRIQDSNAHAFKLPTIEACPLQDIEQVSDHLLSIYRQFWSYIQKVFNSNIHVMVEDISLVYRSILHSYGYLTVGGRVRQKQLEDDLRQFFGDDFLNHIQCNHLSKWIKTLTRTQRNVSHPYYHILLLMFLDASFDSVTKKTESNSSPFGQPNWPCLNHLCTQHNQNVIEYVGIRQCKKTKQPIGRFTCSFCGFSYTRRGVDQCKEDRFRYSRVMKYGDVWEECLEGLINHNLSFSAIARELKVDVKTVMKYHKQLMDGQQEPKRAGLEQNVEIETKRACWLQLQQDYPDLSKTALRKKSFSTYMYLYRHDREWLDNHSPTKQLIRQADYRSDWQRRDKELFDKVHKAYSAILNQRPWRRISRKRLMEEIGAVSMIEKQKDKLPQTVGLINAVAESYESFRLRRVKTVISDMERNGEVVKPWRVFRRANIQKKYQEELMGYLGEY